ncbi:MAG: bifunctional serine/threonine-protein kinase/formylglycine-generating enzyme family protein [Acidobacteriota bacterium]|nr:bifunctional serine/threonine-protein kinase/formylglycine-generating enzyme family protein [Acidobacteriota bacterium]
MAEERQTRDLEEAHEVDEALATSGADDRAPALPTPGAILGNWRLIKSLGAGGMGEVWLGERCDEAFQREVAVKFVKNTISSPDLVARFKRERQILADLRHPHIAVLYDGGTTNTGMPYLVMEYFRGRTVEKWAAGRPVGQILALFNQLCDAVNYAHEKGVLHRDIKPQNIMVTEDDQPKLLDFGIAVREQHTALTAQGHTPMTVEYAPPERLHGGAATVAGDIYSLALVLLELLTGQRPSTLQKPPVQAVNDLHAGGSYDGLQVETLALALDPDPTRRPGRVTLLKQKPAGADGQDTAGDSGQTRQTPQAGGSPISRAPTEPSFVPETCFIPAGGFLMGRPAGEGVADWETPQHNVHLEAFHMGRHPVTNRQYAAFMAARPDHAKPSPKTGWTASGPPPERLDHPVTGVSWFDARTYCLWLSEVTGQTYRLPGEAEWEKAAGGLDGRLYPWGDNWDAERVHLGQATADVDERHPGPFGCCHMLGNVQEWTNTCWGDDPVRGRFPYPYRADDGRESLQAAFHIHRGGAYDTDPQYINCRTRAWSHPQAGYIWRGFRVLRES